MKRIGKLGAGNIYKVIYLPLLTWVVVSSFGLMITSYLVSKEVIDLQSISYGIVITLLLASFLSTTIMINLTTKNPLIVLLISGVGGILLLVLLNLLFVENGMENLGVTALVVFGGAAAAFLVQVKPKKKAPYKIKKI